MRWGLALVVVLLATGVWLKRGVIEAAFAPSAPPQIVYKSVDAQGKVQFGDAAQGANAHIVALKPLTVVKGMTQAEKDAVIAAAAPPPQTAAVACDQEDAQAQARCIHAQTAPRNLALERMQQAAEKLTKTSP